MTRRIKRKQVTNVLSFLFVTTYFTLPKNSVFDVGDHGMRGVRICRSKGLGTERSQATSSTKIKINIKITNSSIS
ncbi:hypothetical protein E2C01_081148 [Portunus trituberculatus]|uniref:Uncharacterized protein n=1 Tax=Portunus trituberculatus TaxID=210409 RepID=A0A5B7IV14_PORTR|nr:hypothetical protein [Portunus trituberculatus]